MLVTYLINYMFRFRVLWFLVGSIRVKLGIIQNHSALQFQAAYTRNERPFKSSYHRGSPNFGVNTIAGIKYSRSNNNHHQGPTSLIFGPRPINRLNSGTKCNRRRWDVTESFVDGTVTVCKLNVQSPSPPFSLPFPLDVLLHRRPKQCSGSDPMGKAAAYGSLLANRKLPWSRRCWTDQGSLSTTPWSQVAIFFNCLWIPITILVL